MEELLKKIQSLCSKKIGINVPLFTDQAWMRKVEQRMKACRVKSLPSYYQMLIGIPDEFQELTELLIVPETWFFRDNEAIDYLIAYYQNEWRKANPQKPMRILSNPCSSGEEAYSIVMAFFNAAVDPKHFIIDAIDISKKALEKAEDGIYTKNAFRGKLAGIKEKYFTARSDDYEILPEIHKQVKFFYGNICSPSIFSDKDLYDAIFCRNLLIYLHPKAQKAVFANISKVLTPKGLLFVAPAEIDICKRNHCIVTEPTKAYVLRKAQKPASMPPPLKSPYPKTNRETEKAPLSRDGAVQSISKKREAMEFSLDKAQKLADHGHFAESKIECLNCLKKYGANAEAYYLLGLIEHVNKHFEAAQKFLLKAIYLKPNHEAALVYLALLAEKQGNKEQAENYKRRAQKAHQAT